jgi:hypothetical protein
MRELKIESQELRIYIIGLSLIALNKRSGAQPQGSRDCRASGFPEQRLETSLPRAKRRDGYREARRQPQPHTDTVQVAGGRGPRWVGGSLHHGGCWTRHQPDRRDQLGGHPKHEPEAVALPHRHADHRPEPAAGQRQPPRPARQLGGNRRQRGTLRVG